MRRPAGLWQGGRSRRGGDPERRDSNRGSWLGPTASARRPIFRCSEDRRPDRRRRLPRPERGDPGGDPQGAGGGSRGGRPVARLRRASRSAATCRSTCARCRASCRSAGTILSTSSYDPFRHEDGVERVTRGRRAGRLRRGRGDRRRAHDEHHAPAARGPRAPAGRRAEDDRQRRPLHRLHVRLRHRCADRDRRDRPPAHDRPVARPRDGDRGDGPQHGLDRRLQRHRGRRRRDRDPRARADRGGDRRLRSTPATERGKSFSIVVVAEGAELAFASGEKRQVRASTETDQLRLPAAGRHRPGAGERDRGSAPASRRASRRSATCSAAARRPRPTACSPPATGSRRRSWRSPASSAAWPRCTGRR